MANWLPCLDSRFPEAVGLACKRKAPLTDANLLMAAHLSGEGAKAGQKDAGRHLQTHPQQVAAPNPTKREPTPRRTPDSACPGIPPVTGR